MVQFASYLRLVLCKTRLIFFPHINGPIESVILSSPLCMCLRGTEIFSTTIPNGQRTRSQWQIQTTTKVEPR